MKENEKKHTSTTVYFQSKYRPEEIWEFLTHPKYIESFKKDPCSFNKIDDDFKLQKGYFWTEIHTGEDCKGDIVKCKIVKLTEHSYFETVRYQAGIKNTSITKLEKNDEGTLITETQKYSLSLKYFKISSLLLWLMLISGLLTKFSFTPEDDMFWFNNMENAIKDSKKINAKHITSSLENAS